MKITPDKFIDMIDAELDKYQNLPTSYSGQALYPGLDKRKKMDDEPWMGGNRRELLVEPHHHKEEGLLEESLWNEKGITGDGYSSLCLVEIDLPDDCKTWRLISAGVEYLLDFQKGADQSEALAHAHPRGRVVYHESSKNPFVDVRFDLEEGVISDMYVRDHGRPDMDFFNGHLRKGLPAEDAMGPLIHMIYWDAQDMLSRKMHELKLK